jgi:hypothetical protein
MNKFADVLLVAMGWSNSHLHAFTVGGNRYGMNDDDFPEGEIDEKTVTVIDALHDVRQLSFEYDFGDSWEHEILMEEQSWSTFGLKFAVCLDGAHACPPEDVGGPWGYAEFLKAIADTSHEEHAHFLEWAGGTFDPTEFDLAEVNALLQKVR